MTLLLAHLCQAPGPMLLELTFSIHGNCDVTEQLSDVPPAVLKATQQQSSIPPCWLQHMGPGALHILSRGERKAAWDIGCPWHCRCSLGKPGSSCATCFSRSGDTYQAGLALGAPAPMESPGCSQPITYHMSQVPHVCLCFQIAPCTSSLCPASA